MSKKNEWFNALVDMGCIVCRNEMQVYSPPDIHHIHRNSRRVDDFHTIPLCPNHHRLGLNNEQCVSRHPWKKEFEKRYGSEWDLYEQVTRYISSCNSERS
jgi:hypothetical protein